ncbi:hypothetical protein [Vibrio phage VP4B]|uniref:Uncharacterized protein n=1 Tax=Vibrio phage VP4B TaxID=1262540 RepID=V9LZ68_9CAUD|nr:hypothetical protein FDJ61_gp043 [Vibrio phage VP4B]AGB07157.1 hypothetical protein [Vibrio phage VP4B]
MENFIYKDVNYMDLVKATFGKHSFYISKWDVETKLPNSGIQLTEERPVEFNTELHIELNITMYSSVTIHITDSLQALEIAKELSSELNKEVVIYSHARYLARFLKGEQVGELRTLDDFYTNITDEERALTRLK